MCIGFVVKYTTYNPLDANLQLAIDDTVSD